MNIHLELDRQEVLEMMVLSPEYFKQKLKNAVTDLSIDELVIEFGYITCQLCKQRYPAKMHLLKHMITFHPGRVGGVASALNLLRQWYQPAWLGEETENDSTR